MKKATVLLAILCAAVLLLVGCVPQEAPAHTHSLTHTEGYPATCTDNGITENWFCLDCGKRFSDAEATTEITFADIEIIAPGHTDGEDDGDCTTAIDCTVCGEVAVAGKSHTAGEDDGDCTTAVACTECKKNAVEAKDAHTGGEATCANGKLCEVCGKEYTERNPDNHADEEFDYADNGDGSHTKYYAVCGIVVDDEEAHSYTNGKCICEAMLPIIDLASQTEGSTLFITENTVIVGDGILYDVTLHIVEDATVIFDAGTGGVQLLASITVADNKTLTLLVKGDAEHIVKKGISLGNGSNVIIEGDLTQANNKLTVTATGGNAGIGANNGVTAGDITIRNARVDATGSSKELSAESGLCAVDTSISGAAIGTSYGSMGDILIENSIIVAEGGYYEDTSHAAAIGIGYVGSTMGNITLKDSQITARNNGDGLASVIGAGANHLVEAIGTLGDIVITNTDLNLSMAIGTQNCYAAMIGSGIGFSHCYVNIGKIIFSDVTQAELDEMIANWLPSDFNAWGAYALGRGYDGSAYQYDAFGGVWVSDGNGGTVQIGDDGGYYCFNDKFN